MIYDPALKYNQNLSRARVKKFCENPSKLVGTTWYSPGGIIYKVASVTEGMVRLVSPDLWFQDVFVEEILGPLSVFSLSKTLPRIYDCHQRMTQEGEPQYFYITGYTLTSARGVSFYPNTHTITRDVDLYPVSFSMDRWVKVEDGQALSIHRLIYMLPETHPTFATAWNTAFPEYPWPEGGPPSTDADLTVSVQPTEEPVLTEVQQPKTLQDYFREDPFGT